MARTRKSYTPEFELRAVKLVLDQKLSVAEVARRLGVGENLPHPWRKAVVENGTHAFPGSGHLTPQEEEIKRLRAEVKRLGMERDILKKATAFFAGQSSRPSPGSRTARRSGRWPRCAGCWGCRGRGSTPGR